MKFLNEDIKTQQFKQVYLLYGDEDYLRKQYRDRLQKALCGDDTMNFQRFEGKDVRVGEVIDLAETLPFLAPRRVLLLENTGWFKKAADEMAEYLAQIPETTFLIFAETEVDKRNKLYKKVKEKGRITEFSRQDESTLKKWILGKIGQEKKKITQGDLNYFLEKTGADMEVIDKEMEKLFCYTLEKDTITGKDIDAVCTRQITNHIFDMISAIGDRKQKQALDLYYDLLALKEPPMRILVLIVRQFNLLLQAKQLSRSGYDNRRIGEKISLPPFIAGKYVTQASHFKSSVLRKALSDCAEMEHAVKTGRLNEKLSVELLIIRYSQAPKHAK